MDSYPRVGIIITSDSDFDCTINCLQSIKNIVKYTNYHVYVADSGYSASQRSHLVENTQNLFHDSRNCTLLTYNHNHKPQIRNDIAFNHVHDNIDLFLFCDSRIELVNDILAYMVKVYIMHKDIIGTLGCRVVTEDGNIHSAGHEVITIKRDGIFYPFTIRNRGYGENNIYMPDGPEEIIANSSSILMINRDVFTSASGFNELYGTAFESLELGVKCLKDELYNLYLDYATCLYYDKDMNTDQQAGVKLNYDYNRIVNLLTEEKNNIKKYVEIYEENKIQVT